MDKTLLFKAAEAAQGIAAAQTAIEDRKRAVEEAKAAVETAKSDLVDAKAAYDSVIAEFVASGVPASKVKRNVEDFLRILGDLGLVESVAEEATAASEQKPQRRKKAEQPSAPAATSESRLEKPAEAVVVEPASLSETVAEAVVMFGDLPAGDTTIEATLANLGEEKIVFFSEAPAYDDEPAGTPVKATILESEADAEEDVPEIAADPVSYGIDNSEAFTEILDLIETITSGEAEAVSETLVTLLNAADWFSREWEKQPLDVQFYRDILNLDFVESALKERMEDELRSALVAVQGDAESIRILEWFAAALDRVESGAEAVSYSEYGTVPSEEGEDDRTVPDAAPEELGDAAEEVVAEQVSDDVTLVGETVDDIGEINFLEDAAAIFAGATVETVVNEVPAPVQASDAKPAEARSFRPRFLGSKG
jgi:hypothetical protein